MKPAEVVVRPPGERIAEAGPVRVLYIGGLGRSGSTLLDRMLGQLDGVWSVGELVEKVGMHQPGVSRHLKVLRNAGLVEVRRDAQRRLYRLRPEPLMELDAWLDASS